MNVHEANISLFLKILEDLQTVINLGTLIDKTDIHFKSGLMGLFDLISRNNISDNNVLNRCHNLLEISKTLSWISTSSLLTLYTNAFRQPEKANECFIIAKDNPDSDIPKNFVSTNMKHNENKRSIDKNEIESFIDRMIESKSTPFPLNTIKNSKIKIK